MDGPELADGVVGVTGFSVEASEGGRFEAVDGCRTASGVVDVEVGMPAGLGRGEVVLLAADAPSSAAATRWTCDEVDAATLRGAAEPPGCGIATVTAPAGADRGTVSAAVARLVPLTALAPGVVALG